MIFYNQTKLFEAGWQSSHRELLVQFALHFLNFCQLYGETSFIAACYIRHLLILSQVKNIAFAVRTLVI